ncbi:MAG: hypothetical protein FGM36_11635, partial [Burkholderiaceae bacterium]|nr:hypothetical protein [Burkholderiaceae bacterium]
MNANQIAIATTATAIFRKLLIREELGSPATIHKRIHQLKDAGFVSIEGQAGDSRVRLVVPTEQALRYFAEHAKV